MYCIPNLIMKRDNKEEKHMVHGLTLGRYSMPMSYFVLRKKTCVQLRDEAFLAKLQTLNFITFSGWGRLFER